MFDFIKNNKLVFGYIFAGLFIILLMFGTMLFLGMKGDERLMQEGDPFPDTAENFENNSTNDTFGPTDSKRWFTDTKTEPPRFRAITDTPVAKGVTFINKKNGNETPFVRYVSLPDGMIYQSPLTVTGDEEEISNEKIYGIGDVVWSNNARSLLIRYYGDKNTVVNAQLGTFSATGTDSVTYNSEQFLENTKNAAFSPDGSEIFYLIRTEDGTTGYIESTQTKERTEVWSSVLRGLTVSWDSPNMILIHTNPSSHANGIVWVLNPKTFEYTPLLGKELALSAKANKTGEEILYSMQEKKSGNFLLRILNVASGKVVDIPIKTITDKCAWGSTSYVYCAVPKNDISGSFIEDWYMGTTHTNDEVWRIDTRNGNVKKLLDPEEETGTPFDIVNMHVTPDETYLVFNSQVNKAFWSLQLGDE